MDLKRKSVDVSRNEQEVQLCDKDFMKRWILVF